MSKFLINESPLTFQPTLASFIGLSEAIVLQQIQYWITNPKAGVWKENVKWVYNSYEKWQSENFPFWSVDGVKKIFLRLEDMGILVSKQLSDDKWNKTKYYRIDYQKLDEILDPLGSANPTDGVPSTQSTITETTTETTNMANDEKAPSLPHAFLSLENQIYAGLEIKEIPDANENARIDTANLISMGMGTSQKLAFSIAYVFMKTRNIIIPQEDVKSQRKPIRAMIKANVLPSHVEQATKKLMDAKYTTVDLYSIYKTAIDLANPVPGQDFSSPQYSKFD